MKLLEEAFEARDLFILDLDQIPTKVKIHRGDAGIIKVLITGQEKYRKDVSAALSGNTVTVRGPKTYVGATIVSGHTVSISSVFGGMSIRGNSIIINGQRVEQHQGSDSSSENEPLAFQVWLPDNSELILGSVGNLSCDPNINKAHFKIGGQSTVELGTVAAVEGFISDQSEVTIQRMTGSKLPLAVRDQSKIKASGLENCEVQCSISDQSEARLEGSFSMLNLKASDQSKVRCEGTFASVTLEVSDQSDVRTKGTVSGDYVVSARDMSEVKHRGGVAGEVKKSSRDMSEVSVK